MPFLDNPRHEIFAKARAKGVTLDDAYELAGFATIRGHSSRVAQRPDVAARIAELRLATAGWEETTGQAIVTAMLRMAEARDFFDSPQRMKETRLTLMEARKLQKELIAERESERNTTKRTGKPAVSALKTCQKPAKNLPKPATTLALAGRSTRTLTDRVHEQDQ
jgi:hypothetical protein